MKAIFKLVSVVAVLSSLAGCGVGQADNDQYAAQNRKDAQELQSRFEGARGTYDGTFTLADTRYGPQQARLTLNVVNVREGTNPDGSVHVRPALFGRFRLNNAVTETDYLALTGDMDTLGGINLTSVTNQTNPGGGIYDPTHTQTLSLHGDLSADGTISLQVTNTSGYWGTFNGTRTSDQAPSAADGNDADARDRLIEIYSHVTGDYTSPVDYPPYHAKVKITLATAYANGDGGPNSLPVLVAHYRRLDFPEGVGDETFTVTYNSLSGRISMLAMPRATRLPGSLQMSGYGTLVNGRMDISITDFRGVDGHFAADRVPAKVPSVQPAPPPNPAPVPAPGPGKPKKPKQHKPK